MPASIVYSIIFFLLFIILSLFVDVSGFAAEMEHRKLGGVKETMTMRRNLEENSPLSAAKIAASGSVSSHSRSRNAKPEPSQTQPGARGQSNSSNGALPSVYRSACGRLYKCRGND